MSTGDASNAFISGQVDAAAIWEPSLSMAQKETGGNIPWQVQKMLNTRA